MHLLELACLCVQAFGAHRFDQLGTIYQRTVTFCMMHCIPMNLMFAALPSLLKAMGQQPVLVGEVTQYLLAMFPTVYLHSIIRQVGSART